MCWYRSASTPRCRAWDVWRPPGSGRPSSSATSRVASCRSYDSTRVSGDTSWWNELDRRTRCDMKWTAGNRENVEDLRGSSGGGMRMGGLGIGGLLLVLILSWATGVDFLSLLGGGAVD